MKKTENIRTIRIVDTTLRDGEQAPGVVFTTQERIAIATALDHIGIDEIEAGIPAMGETACRDIRKLSNLGLNCYLSSWCRAVKHDLILAARCRTPSVHISFPTSSVLLKTFDKNEAWVLNQLEALVKYAGTCFDRVSVGAQDATRTDGNFLKQFALLAFDAGAESLRLADTVGMINPSTVIRLISTLKKAVPGLELEFHGHNDLGMATANAVTAVDAGADALSVTVNGLGERAGNAPLEEVVMALFEIGGYKKEIHTAGLSKLCHTVAAASGMDIAPSKPITGRNVFRHESGIHCDGLLKNKESYQLFNPEQVGNNDCEYIIGYHSGSSAIAHVLEKQGIQISRQMAKKLIPLVREAAIRQKSALTPDQLRFLHRKASATTIDIIHNAIKL